MRHCCIKPKNATTKKEYKLGLVHYLQVLSKLAFTKNSKQCNPIVTIGLHWSTIVPICKTAK